jgi:DNA-binding SARP family transcriptional activator
MAGFAPIIDAARGRTPSFDAAYTWPETEAIAQLYAMSHAADQDGALSSARAAARAADRRRDPFVQILAHVAIHVLAPAERKAEAATLLELSAQIESPELAVAIDGIVAGGFAGMLDRYVQTRVTRERMQPHPRVVVELLSGRIRRNGTEVRLSGKELELITYLATARGPQSRQRIGETLWDHLDPEEWGNNLKVTAYRVRAKLGVRDVIVTDNDGGYRLAPNVMVDLHDLERTLRESSRMPLGADARAHLNYVVASHRSGNVKVRLDRVAWAQALAAQLDDLVCAAGVTLAQDALARGLNADALAFARGASAVDPFNERAVEVIIRVLLAMRDEDAARREFRRYASALDVELSAKPSELLSSLMRVPH